MSVVCSQGSTQLGAPYQVERLGTTYVPFPVFQEYIQGLATSSYTSVPLQPVMRLLSDRTVVFTCMCVCVQRPGVPSAGAQLQPLQRRGGSVRVRSSRPQAHRFSGRAGPAPAAEGGAASRPRPPRAGRSARLRRSETQSPGQPRLPHAQRPDRGGQVRRAIRHATRHDTTRDRPWPWLCAVCSARGRRLLAAAALAAAVWRVWRRVTASTDADHTHERPFWRTFAIGREENRSPPPLPSNLQSQINVQIPVEAIICRLDLYTVRQWLISSDSSIRVCLTSHEVTTVGWTQSGVPGAGREAEHARGKVGEEGEAEGKEEEKTDGRRSVRGRGGRSRTWTRGHGEGRRWVRGGGRPDNVYVWEDLVVSVAS